MTPPQEGAVPKDHILRGENGLSVAGGFVFLLVAAGRGLLVFGKVGFEDQSEKQRESSPRRGRRIRCVRAGHEHSQASRVWSGPSTAARTGSSSAPGANGKRQRLAVSGRHARPTGRSNANGGGTARSGVLSVGFQPGWETAGLWGPSARQSSCGTWPPGRCGKY